MLEKRPLYDDYWELKRIPVENITDIPMYITASYSTMLHTYGSLQTLREAKIDKKWLRVHPYQESGYCKATLWVSCPDHNDMDTWLQMRKINATGKALAHLDYACPVPESDVPDVNTAKCLGPQGFLRTSHRNTRDCGRLPSDVDLFYSHREQSLIGPGTRVQMKMTTWPIGMPSERGHEQSKTRPILGLDRDSLAKRRMIERTCTARRSRSLKSTSDVDDDGDDDDLHKATLLASFEAEVLERLNELE
ncbi:hypothetical protein BJX62DRAFT_239491 [Aspergillus germanicus]